MEANKTNNNYKKTKWHIDYYKVLVDKKDGKR
jgi:Uri superfamily endonuclease